MTNVLSPEQARCPFVAGGMITDPRLFVGRKRELRDIALRMEGAQPISINVYGERRIGKSSLLYHFYQTWRQRVQDSSRYAVVYLTLQHGSITTEPALYGAIAAALRPALPRRLHPALHQANDRSGFARLMETCCQQGILPVLCIDEFETLFRHRQAFDDDFYDAMRALMDRNQMMLVLASQRPVDVYSQQQRLTSRFFNLGHTLRLGELSDEEADELVRLPARAWGDAPPALNRRQQLLARRWGGRHPYRLQLAAFCLWQAAHEGRDERWARRCFDEQASRALTGASQRPLARIRAMLARTGAMAWRLPGAVGGLARRIGDAIDSAQNAVLGIIVLLIAAALLLGWLNWNQVIDLLNRLAGN